MVERFEVEIVTSSDWMVQPSILRFIIDICAVKAKVVEADEREKGVRKILNFGHTIGHALEKLTSYGAILHGQAVLVGMWIEAAWAASQGWTDVAVVETLEIILKA